MRYGMEHISAPLWSYVTVEAVARQHVLKGSSSTYSMQIAVRLPISNGVLISSRSDLSLIITVTDGEGGVKGKSLSAKQGARQGQALSRMMVVDHSVRLRRPHASMVLI